MGKITPNSAIVVKQEEKGVILYHLQSNFRRLSYGTLSGAHQDINKRLHFPHLVLSRPSEIPK